MNLNGCIYSSNATSEQNNSSKVIALVGDVVNSMENTLKS